MTSIRLTLTTLGLTLLLASAVAAATPEQAVQDAEQSWAKAVVAGDAPTLGRLLSDDLSYGHASGAQDTKQTYIDRIKSGAQKYLSVQYDAGSIHVHVYGSAAVLVASAQIHSLTDGVDNALHLRFLHVYIRNRNAWQLVAHQSVKLPK
jgi:ketosteroid isomerase-like protein